MQLYLMEGKVDEWVRIKLCFQSMGKLLLIDFFSLLNNSFASVAIVGADDDIYQGIGVLGGLHSALKKSAQKACFCKRL